MEKFKETYNASLANGLGNLASRVMTLAANNLAGPVAVEVVPYPQEYADALERFETNRAMDYVWGRIGTLDQRITHEEPFKLVKTDPERGRAMIIEMVKELAAIHFLLEPVLPDTSKKILKAIMANTKPESLFPRKE